MENTKEKIERVPQMKRIEPAPEITYETNTKMQVPRSIKRKISVVVAIAFLVAALIGSCFAWFWGRSSGKKTYEQIVADLKVQVAEQKSEISGLNDTIETLKDMPIVVNRVAPEISLDVLENQLNAISELTTYEFLFTNAGKFSDSKNFFKWNIVGTEKSFILKWNGVIKAGIDINEVKITADKETATITIWIPEAKITSYTVDKENMEMLDEKNNIFNKITVQDVTNFDVSTEKEMRSRAVDFGILEKAQQQAEYVIRNFLLSIPDIKEFYTLEFQLAEKS